MRQLTGLDAAFLHLETTRTPMHIGGLSLYDPAQSPHDRFSLDAAIEFVNRRLHLAPTLRRRLAPVPLGLDHPYWIEDPGFAIEGHIRHLALPRPGDWRQLCQLVATLHATPLDRSRPLWEFVFIEGLDSVGELPRGCYGVLSKIHHAAIDGVSGAELVLALNDVSPDAQPAPPISPWKPEVEPSTIELLGRAAVGPWIRGARWVGVAGRTVPALGRLAAGLGRRQLQVPQSFGVAPRTRFNHSLSSSRVFDGRGFPLDDIKAIKNRITGATVNDAVLAVCGGALRRYLGDKGELPEKRSLVAMTPVSVRSDEERGEGGNLVSLMLVSLGTDITRPLDRLRHVHEQALESKAINSAIGARLLTDASEALPPVPIALAATLYAQLGMANVTPPLFNCIVTNVPGPRIPLYSAGSRLVSHYGLGPVADGVGLMLPVFSYCDKLAISLISCPDMVPDPEVLAESLEDSFLELRAAVRPKKRRPPRLPGEREKPERVDPARPRPQEPVAAGHSGLAAATASAA